MTVKLTSSFLSNARGLTLLDSASVTWAINANTNEIKATGSGGGGGLTSVGLADTSTTPIYTVSNTPLVANGTIDITLSTQAAKAFFAGPTSGGAAQPTFRSIAAGDLPAGVPTGSANPSATIGLAAVNGSAATFMTSDSAPALSQAITPTWTGQHIFTPSSAVTAVIVNTTANNVGVSVQSGSGSGAIVEVCGDGSGTGNGLSITQTSVGAGLINLNFNAALTFKVNGTNRMVINASGGVVVGGATGGDEGAGTLNAQGLYINGVLVNGGNVGGAGDTTMTWMAS